MEIEHSNYSLSAFKGIVTSCDPQVQICFLQFLQTQILMQIAQMGRKYKRQEYFYRLATVLIYFKKYLNRVDRSMYYMFYEEKSFVPLEQGFIINIAKNDYQSFFQLTNKYQNLLGQLDRETQFIEEKEQFRQLIDNIFFETDYPLPTCKRQTIGVYCETPFQNFLSTIRFPTIQSMEEFIQPPLQQMRKYFLQDIDMDKTVKNIYDQGIQVKAKMNILRYCPYEIKKFPIQNLLINDFELHNIIVILFHLVATNAMASYTIVKSHVDPIMRMAQFVTRANIYKNLILSIQEKFKFLFNTYQDIFDIVSQGQTDDKLIPKFQFWNGALTIWVQQFTDINEQLYQSFNYILLKERQTNAINYLAQKSEILPSIYNTVKLQLEEKNLFDQKRSQLYKDQGVAYEQFFQQSIDSYEILAKDFLQHEIDTSINQINVHKCGHSDHVIKRIPFFRNFIDSIKEQTALFYSSLQQAIFKKHNDSKLRIGILRDLIKYDMDFIDGKFMKPVILKEILSSAQGMIEMFVKKIPQFAVFAQQGLQKFSLHFDFSHKDNMLDYFCSKSDTPDDCSQKYRCFYDSCKGKSVEEMISLAMSGKAGVQEIDSEIDEEWYQSSLSNASIGSIDLE